MKISHIAAECSPLAQVGGLGDVVGALTEGLARQGHEVELFLPFYSLIDRQSIELDERPEPESIRIGQRRFGYSIASGRRIGSAVTLRLVDCSELFDLPGVYSGDAEEPWRYALLTAVALRAVREDAHPATIVHSHDWHAALASALLRSTRFRRRDGTAPCSVLTLHNLAHQGVFGAEMAVELGVAAEEAVSIGENRFNFLETGIRSADLLTTVSPTYAEEIQTEEHGMGLEGLLKRRRHRLFGVLNGVDEEVWSPTHDELLPAVYSVDDLSGKQINKQALQHRAGWARNDKRPVLGMVSRLVEQKGCDLFRHGFDDLLVDWDASLVVLGTGDPVYERMFAELRRLLPDRVAFFNEFNVELAHLVEAGSDLFLMPSRFEPCGLNQMYSMLYGTVPVVHRTGGLADTVQPFDLTSGEGTGWVFDRYGPEAFFDSVRAAVDLFRRPVEWRRVMRNAMAEEFSWSVSVRRYVELYERLADDGIHP